MPPGMSLKCGRLNYGPYCQVLPPDKSLHRPAHVSVTRFAYATRAPDSGATELDRQAASHERNREGLSYATDRAQSERSVPAI